MMDTEDELLTKLATLKDAIRRGLLVPIIRCGQCRYWDELPSSTIAPEYHLCKRIAYHASTADGFCDRAERKDNPDENAGN